MAKRYKKCRDDNTSSSNNSITFIEEELITKESNSQGIARRNIYAK